MRTLMIIAGILLAATTTAHAATFEVKTFSDSGKNYILMEGAVEEYDLYKLKTAMGNDVDAYGATLVMNSPGGSAIGMEKLAAFVEERFMNTVVYDGDICYSACAVIWAHGSEKYMQSGAEIGFHVSSMAMTPESVKWLETYHDGYGWAGIQQLVQDNYAEALRFYAKMDVADVNAFVANIALASGGPNFWMVTYENKEIIGGVKTF